MRFVLLRTIGILSGYRRHSQPLTTVAHGKAFDQPERS
jgi:hypothetical protein